MEGGEPLTYTITAVSNPGAPAGTDLVTNINGQSAKCTTAVGSTTLTIQDEADLAVQKTGPASVNQGDSVTYTIKVWNRGPTPVASANFSDNVPATLTGVTWSCAASGSAVCGTSAGSGNNISVTTGVLPVNTAASNPTSGSYLTFTVTGTAANAGSLPNTASIAPPVGVVDPSGGNNSSTTTTQVLPPPPSISGTVYNDNNGNSSLDSGEPRLANVLVELLSGSTVIATQSTDAAGNYTFTGIAPGTYTVRVSATDPDLPPGSSLTTPNNLSVTVPAGSAVTGQNFGFRRSALDVIKSAGAAQQINATTYVVPYTIVVGNTGQLALPNVQVTENLSQTFPGSSSITIVAGSLSATAGGGATCTLNSAFNGTSDTRLLSGLNTLNAGQSCIISFSARVAYASAAAVPSVPQNNTAYGSSRTTGPNPGYTFPGGVPTPPTGAIATDASTNTTNPATPAGLPSTPGGDSPSATPVSLTPNPGSIQGTLYNDLNNNGSFDPTSDPRLPANIEVQLLDGGGTVIATTQTDANGNYAFASVSPGSYSVRVVPSDPQVPPGLTPSAPATGSAPVSVTAGSPSTQNFGFQRVAVDVIKSAGTPVQINPTTFEVPFAVVVGNTGNVAAPNVQVSENLSRTFSAGGPTISLVGSPALTVTPSSGAICTANASFNGTSVYGLLAGTDDLAPGQSCTISFRVRLVYPSTGAIPSAPQNNQVYASSLPGTGTNPGHSFPGGVPTPPPGALATDASSNTTHPANPNVLPSTPNADTPGATPVSLVTNLGSISGTLYNDLNGNKSFDDTPADSRLGAGITVQLVDGSGNVVASTTTDASGNYSFNAVAPGTYTLRVPTGAGNPALGTLQPVAPASAQITGVTVAPGTVSNNRNFGFSNPPVATDDSATTSFNTPITFSVVGNDTDPDGFVDPATIDLDPSTPGDQKTRTVPGQGTFTVDSSGNVTFTPAPTFTGNTTPVQYIIADNTGAVSNPASIRVTVGPPAIPVANPDTATTPFGTPVTLNPPTNDTAGPGTTLVPGSIDLDPGAPGQQTTRTVPGQGRFDLNPTTGQVTFTPDPGFAGTVQIPYTIQDNLGQTSAPSTLTVNVTPPPAPVARDDAKAGDFNQPVVVPALLNDTPSPGTTLVPGSIDLDPSTPGQETTRTIPGKGTFTVQPDGTVRFDPVPGFEGTAVVPYTIRDNLGQTSNPANIAVTIRPRPAPPTAADDQATTPRGTPVTLNAAANDTANLPNVIDPASIDLDPSTPGRQTTLNVPGRGTFEARPDGTVIFTPEPGFVGVVTIPYTINDQDSDPNTPPQTSNRANLSVTVTELPAAVDDRAQTPVNTPVNVPVAANDVTNPGQTMVPSSIDLDPDTPGQQTTRTVPGQGTFALQPDGSVRFTPEPGFVGTATTPYTVQDSAGVRTKPANLIITVTPPPPTAADDQARTPFRTPVTLYPSTNDTPGAGGQLVPGTIDLDPSTPGQQTERVVPGKGRFVLQPATNLNNESVQFIPEGDFTGTVSIPYTLQDNFGQTSSPANLTVTVNPPTAPIANNDLVSTKRDTPVTLNPAGNDTPGLGTGLDPRTIDLDPSTPGQQTRFEVPGQGVFELQPGGNVVFTPAPGFTGTVQAPYTIQDQTGQTSNTARLVVTVNPLPAASNDSANTPFNTPVTLNPLTNDTPSDGATLDPSTLDLDPLTPGVQESLTVPGKGTFTRNPDGSVTFTPAPGFTGTVTIPYTVKDTSGSTTNTANIAITVRAPVVPTARDDSATTPYNTPVTLNPIANDIPGAGATLDPSTLDLDPATPGIQNQVIVPGKGTFVRNPDGTVTFTPVEGFTGTVEVPYTIRDNAGQESNPATIRVEVRGPNLVLEKAAAQGVARMGGRLEYILKATNQGSGAPMRQVTLSDLLPVGLEYRAGSSTLNGTPFPDPQITNEGGRQRLVWVVGELAPGQSASLRFATTVTAAAPTTGPLVNTAEASALIGSSLNPVRVNSNVATATVRIEAGVFSDKGTILGRVYFDKNNDNNYTAGIDEPLQGVRVYLSDGRYAVTDEQGRYSLTEVLPGLNTLRVDRLTVPYVPKAVPDDRGLRGTRQVRVEGGGLYTEDFLFENPGSQAAVTRSTRVTVDGQRLEKTLTQVSSNTYTVTLTLTLNKAVNNLRISDPLPTGGSRGAVAGPNLQPSVQGSEIRLGNLQPGTYTLTYTLSGNLPIDRLITDPDLFWEEVRR